MNTPILTIPNPKLREISDEVVSFDKSLEDLINNLIDTLDAQIDPPGLGLSAPQLGVLKRVFVAKIRNKPKAFVNPKIIKFSKKEIAFLEGCFSVPDIYGHVIRPAEIDLESQDRQGKSRKEHYKGIAARIIQHELDHLNGTLFVDHVHTQGGKVFKIKKVKGGHEHLEEVALV